MIEILYIQLLNEGTIVYRPVPAKQVSGNIYQIQGDELYNPEEEDWEFQPGSTVLIEEKK
jgi:hypothetical protein